tara:strand:+ start:1521 stop:1802 length:282 start_codon:yes stop_codon:yes gene_type:complete
MDIDNLTDKELQDYYLSLPVDDRQKWLDDSKLNLIIIEHDDGHNTATLSTEYYNFVKEYMIDKKMKTMDEAFDKLLRESIELMDKKEKEDEKE